jgi:hypothetical protein
MIFHDTDGEDAIASTFATYEDRVHASLLADLNKAMEKNQLVLERLDDRYHAAYEVDEEAVGDLEEVKGNAAQRAQIQLENEAKRMKYWLEVWIHAGYLYYFSKWPPRLKSTRYLPTGTTIV